MKLRQARTALTLLAVLTLGLQAAAPLAAADSSRITQYRVYQNDKPLREFAGQNQAIQYAKYYRNSRVEKIQDRAWVWDNFPRYAVYANGETSPKLQFQTYNEALRAAEGLKHVYIRDYTKPGWVYSNLARYRLYHGHETKPAWTFATIAEAKKIAAYYPKSHIIDTATNQWIWDNLSTEQEEAERARGAVYVIYKDGEPTDAAFGFLRDAIRASASIEGSKVVHMNSGYTAHVNIPSYAVYQNGRERKQFHGLMDAVQYAKKLAGSEVIKDGRVWWTNIPYLRVFQGEELVRYFHARPSAVEFAGSLQDASVRTEDGRTIWSNSKRLLYLGWNGSSRPNVVLSQAANTQGLDIDSPTWFELAAADGSLKDTSDRAAAAQLQAKGIAVMPLVNNQFDRKMTSEFLADSAARKRFIEALVKKLIDLRVEGVNLDFEEVAAADRDRFTAFVGELAAAVHAKGLTISIDLLRGSAAWNHLTAYDHEKLAQLVDYVIIMAYDQHWRGSDTPGSVAGLEWTEQGILDYLSYGIPRSKLMLGVPFYVREWQIDAAGKLVDSRAVLMKDIPALLDSVDEKTEFDARFGQTKVTYHKNGFKYVFWVENEATVKARIALAKKYDLAGVAAWRLGYEPAELWTAMLQLK